jgi:hypothetical protein
LTKIGSAKVSSSSLNQSKAMFADKFKILEAGRQVGIGKTEAFHVSIGGIAKSNSQSHPYVVPNELVCGALARAILLPVPPGFVVEHKSLPHYVSLNFNFTDEKLAPADTSLIAAQWPDLAAGIVLFDIWILNDDRHDQSIYLDRTTEKLYIFDHSHAFLRRKGRARLLEKASELAIGNHCLASKLPDLSHFNKWHERIKSIPEFYIREVLVSATKVGLSEEDVDFCVEYLVTRRSRLAAIVNVNMHRLGKGDEFGHTS